MSGNKVFTFYEQDCCKMRIAVWHNLPSGGGARALHQQIKGLTARGHCIEVFCQSTADRSYMPIDDIIPVHVMPITITDWKTSSKVGKLTSLMRYYKALDAIISCAASTAKIINSAKFDVALVHPDMYFSVSPIGRFLEIPKVLYLQEPNRLLYESQPALLWEAPPRPVCRTITSYMKLAENTVKTHCYRVQVREERKNASSYNRILANSFFSRESILRAYGLDAYVSYLGVDSDVFKPISQPRQNIVINVGAIRPSKNIEHVIKAISTIQKNRPDYVHVGNACDTKYLRFIKCLASECGVNITVITNATENELLSWYQKAKVLAYAPRLEPFGFVPLEANACGVPVVAVAEGGVRETVVNDISGILIDNTPSSMGDAIERLCRDINIWKKFSDNGRKYVIKHWSINSSIDMLLKNIEEVM